MARILLQTIVFKLFKLFQFKYNYCIVEIIEQITEAAPEENAMWTNLIPTAGAYQKPHKDNDLCISNDQESLASVFVTPSPTFTILHLKKKKFMWVEFSLKPATEIA